MRVLLVIDNLGWGGSQRQMANLARGLQRRGHDVRLFQYYPRFDHYRSAVVEAGVTLLDFEKRRKSDPAVIVALARIMRRERPDVAVAFLPGPSAFTVLAARLAGGPPVVVSERGSFRPGPLPLFLRLQRVTHHFAAHVTANSFHQAERMRVEFPRLAARTSTIWNGIDTEHFRPRPRVPEADGALRLLGVGTVVAIKDIETLAHGVATLARRGGPDLRVDWAGKVLDPGPSHDVVARVGAVLAEQGLADRWRWLGLQEDMTSLYAGCDALVHPSAREGLPNAVCEALACGRPVVVPRGADHERLTGDGQRGILFDAGDPGSLAAALASLSALGADGRARLGARAREFAERALSLEACLDAYEALLARVAART